MKKYIVSYSERSSGPQCNGDYANIFESEKYPTEDLLKENHIVVTGTCTNVSYPGCEDCGGSHIIGFKVEEYSELRAKELGLEKIITLK